MSSLLTARCTRVLGVLLTRCAAHFRTIPFPADKSLIEVCTLQETLGYMKEGAWLVNTARGALCVAEDVAEAVNSGRLSG